MNEKPYFIFRCKHCDEIVRLYGKENIKKYVKILSTSWEDIHVLIECPECKFRRLYVY